MLTNGTRIFALKDMARALDYPRASNALLPQGHDIIPVDS
jgi:hypothetical protein